MPTRPVVDLVDIAKSYGNIAGTCQDLAVVPLMPVWRNFFLGSEPTRGAGPFCRIDVRKMREITDAADGAYAPVGNEDLVAFAPRFSGGALGTGSVFRVAHAPPEGLGFELFCTKGSAGFDLHRASEFTISDRAPQARTNGRRQVFVGPAHPYIHNGLPVDSPCAGDGTADMFV
jgi:predicted dehydrogenase